MEMTLVPARQFSPTSPLARVYRGGIGTAVTVVYMGTLLLTNVVQMLSVLVRPFSKRLFRRINRACANFWWGLCVVGSEWCFGLRTVFTGDDVPPRENAIVIANHQQMPDILALQVLAWRKYRLGDMKWMVKAALRWVPGLGWGMVFLDCLFLNRNWESDKSQIQAAFGRFRAERIPVWLVSFPEGTRLTPAKLAKSREFAAKSGVAPTEAVLLPRTKGFVAAVGGLEGHMQAVYDVTIGYPHGVPTLWQYVCGLTKEIHLHVRRHPVAELPKDPTQLAKWLVDRFREKDALMVRFQRAGSFR